MRHALTFAARLAPRPGEQYACAWPLDPGEEAERIAATFWRYRLGMMRRR